MGLLGSLFNPEPTDEELKRASPSYQARMQAKQNAQYFKTQRVTNLGEIAQQAQIEIPQTGGQFGTLGQEAQEERAGTGIYKEGYSPAMAQMRTRNQNDIESGIPSVMAQAHKRIASMQGERAGFEKQRRKSEFDLTNRELPAQPTAYREYLLASEQGFNGSFMDYKSAVKSTSNVSVDFDQGGMSGVVSDEDKASMGLDGTYVWAKDGTPKPVKSTTFSDAQLVSGGFADRQYESDSTIDALMAEGFNPTDMAIRMSEKLPMGGQYILSSEQQIYKQAANDWIRAKLRKESGAVIADEEMEKEYQTYFPMPGDGKGVINAKRLARERATKAMAKQSGGSYDYKVRRQSKPVSKYDGMSDAEIEALYNERKG